MCISFVKKLTQRRHIYGGVTKAPFVNFSFKEIFDLAKYLLSFLNHFHIWWLLSWLFVVWKGYSVSQLIEYIKVSIANG